MSKLIVKTAEKKYPVAPDLYGLFFEDINRAGDSGLYPEMLRNRSFEDSIPPERCVLSEDGAVFTTPNGWSDQFNGGEGLKRWLGNVPPTPIPAWYADGAVMALDDQETLNAKRLVSLKVAFSAGGSIRNIGYQGVPLKKGDTYAFFMFAKAQHGPVTLNVAIASSNDVTQDQTTFEVQAGAFQRFDAVFTASEDDCDGMLVITSPAASQVWLGFLSLMPTDTYKGHGMRKDLMELLAGSRSKFLRFPGGCIVEGFTYETAMRFSNTIGPVWERPSHQLMWHYRTTNGLGFHEYLQICEDLALEPMYVVNCGLTCQGREPEFFEGEELDGLLREAFDAIEYAIGDVSTPMGRVRAEMGHSVPFNMTYIEIGNENSGPEYFSRYRMFYEALKAKYPEIKYISNMHTEKHSLPTEIADEHFYNTPEFFAEQIHMYDGYDRKGPEIFVGEYAVTVGKTATLRCALAESMFLLGVENNQDIVKMTAYAPLFQNVGYTGWFPNLIVFDNHRSFGIPSYHSLSMLAGSRGSVVVESSVETGMQYRNTAGLPGLLSEGGGFTFRNARMNGKPVAITHEIKGRFSQTGEETACMPNPPVQKSKRYLVPGHVDTDSVVFAVLGDEPQASYTFEVEAKSTDGRPITIASWCHRPFSVFQIDETKDPNKLEIQSTRRFQWTVDGSSTKISEVQYGRPRPTGNEVELTVELGQYNTYKVVTRPDGFDCYLNDRLVQKALVPNHPVIAAGTVTDGDSVIVKVVNFCGSAEDVEIALDCPVQSGYQAQVLSSDDPDAMNSLETPRAVAPVTLELTGAARNFTYQAPAWSLSVLAMKRGAE